VQAAGFIEKIRRGIHQVLSQTFYLEHNFRPPVCIILQMILVRYAVHEIAEDSDPALHLPE
jgi:hypothetical protein